MNVTPAPPPLQGNWSALVPALEKRLGLSRDMDPCEVGGGGGGVGMWQWCVSMWWW